MMTEGQIVACSVYTEVSNTLGNMGMKLEQWGGVGGEGGGGGWSGFQWGLYIPELNNCGVNPRTNVVDLNWVSVALRIITMRNLAR